MESNKLSVRLYGKPLGVLEKSYKGQLQFSYKKDADMPLSQAMPLREKVFDSRRCEGYFGGLLPEDDRTRADLAKIMGILPNDTFGFLREMGFDCIGAVSFHQPHEAIDEEEKGIPLEGTVLTHTELEKFLKELTHQPFFSRKEEMLSGFYPKTGVCLIDDDIALPLAKRLTTHIIKPAGDKGAIENEFFCMKLAHSLGLEVPEVQMRRVGYTWVLIVKRYDRQIIAHHVIRKHQEDFCQALGLLPSARYQHLGGGVSFKDCFALLNKTRVPAIERNRLIKLILFNYIIGNCNAHGKNLSLLYLSPKQLIMAPFYGLYSCVCGHESSKMAMKIGKNYHLSDVSLQDWQFLCKEVGFSFPALKSMLLAFIDLSITCAHRLKLELYTQGHDSPIIAEICALIEQQGERAYKSMIFK